MNHILGSIGWTGIGWTGIGWTGWLMLLLLGSPCTSMAQLEPAAKTTSGPVLTADVSFGDELRASYALASEWFRHSMREKGLFRYNFKPGPENVYSSKNNAIRQLMATRLLAEMSREDSSLLPMHRKNLDFLMTYWYQEHQPEPEEGDMFFESPDLLSKAESYGTEAYMHYNNKSKLGANAMMLRTFVISPYYEEYEIEARRIYRGIRACVNADGSMKAFYVPPSYSYDEDYLLTFYSGEGILALVEYAEKTGDPEVLNLAMRCQDHYIHKYVDEMAINYYPAYVPWHTLSLNKLYKLTGEERYAHAALALTDKVLEIQDTSRVVGRFYNPLTPQYGSPHTSSDGVYTEGLAYALELAHLLGDEARTARYQHAIGLAIQNLRRVQLSPEACEGYELPERAVGGFVSRLGGSWVRIDCGQHILDAYRKLLRLMQDERLATNVPFSFR